MPVSSGLSLTADPLDAARARLVPVQPEPIPATLRALDRWVLWSFTLTKDGAITKVPYQASRLYAMASTTDLATWSSFATAIDAYQDGKADGIGFVFTRADGVVGFDADDCRDPQTGALLPEVLAYLDLLDTYSEVSPGRDGVHALCLGRKPGPRCRVGRYELYDDARFFCVTGHRLPDSPATVEARTAAVLQVYTSIFAPTLPLNRNGDGNGHASRRMHLDHLEYLDDAHLLRIGQRASNGRTLTALLNGETSTYGGDDSAADLALCNLLAFYLEKDPARIDAVFRASGLMREKWDSRRGAETYGALTLAKAIAGCASTYTGMSPAARAVCAPTDDRLTDYGSAERFTQRHGDDVRFDYRRSRWLLWQGHRWIPDADAAVRRLALDFARTWQREAVEIPDRTARETAVTFAIRLERRDAIHNMLDIAKALLPIANAGEHWDEQPWLLSTPNGVVDLRTATLRPGHPADGITMSTATPYIPDATCPRWERFISEIFAGDRELMSFVQRAVGYSLTGMTTEQVLFLLYGTGANGKGTLTNTLARVLGDYAWNMPFSTVELKDRSAIPNDLAALVHRRFVIASETNDGSRLNEGRIKALTGCDPITARFLHGEFFTFEPVATFWLSVNHKPVVKDDSFGFWRRIRLIPFTQRFDVDPTLAVALQAEANGILAWCVRSCLAWQRDGLQAPAIVTTATREYEQDSDPLAAFLEEACELAPGAEVGARDLFEHYVTWAQRHGFGERERLSATGFGRKVAERFQHVRPRGRRVYLGLARLPVAGLGQ